VIEKVCLVLATLIKTQ